MTTTSPGRQFLDEQLEYLGAKDVDSLIDNHYKDDALLVGFDFTVRGQEALREHFRNYLQTLGDLKLISLDKFTETGDTIFLEATMETSNLGVAQVYDAFVLDDGKVTYHFTGLK